MPWNESNRMDERVRFLTRLLDGEKISVVCRDPDHASETTNRHEAGFIVGFYQGFHRELLRN
jgi:hypothetical protein